MVNKTIKRHLDRLYKTFDLRFLSSDPLLFVHRFKKKEDREVVGLIASSLAYGRVAGIKKSLENVLGVMGASPYLFTMRFRPRSQARLFSGFVHRFNTGEDIACLLNFMRQMIEEKGSIGGFFAAGYSSEDKNVKNALISFSERALRLDASGIYGNGPLPKEAGVRFFFPTPANGGPCKRLNLYLRWMVRSDKLDFGLWKGVEPSRLVIPLDTHIARISRNIGLTGRSSPDWKMAEEITDALKELDPKDPVKYDFALCRLGILDKCPRKADLRKCEDCLIKEICVL
jgi:uncharacterized protein (TIGR02757 family)